VRALGDPEWATDASLATAEGRRAHHDAIDEHLAAWAERRDAAESAELLVAHGVPAALGRDPRLLADHPQLRARHYHEDVDHPVVGVRPTPTVPFRYASVERWLRGAAPTLGAHNRDILGGLLGVDDDELADLEAGGVIGTRPKGL
jgi:crotonobetainyl-CoA:carnitine CoA-transferase CaiB-like acyl-CoA transferase